MDDVAIARAIHVIAVVFWIGGVAMVTTVLVPAVRRFKSPEERTGFFELVEHRFARQSRVSTLIAGFSGFYMVYRLFVLEPAFLHRWFLTRARVAPEATFRLIHGLHWLLLSLSIITIFAAVAGSHGSLLFGWQ